MTTRSKKPKIRKTSEVISQLRNAFEWESMPRVGVSRTMGRRTGNLNELHRVSRLVEWLPSKIEMGTKSRIARHSEIAFYYVCYANSEVFALTPDPLAGKYYPRTGHPRSFFAKLTKS